MKVKIGVTTGNTALCFEKAENSSLNLTGKCKGYVWVCVLSELYQDYNVLCDFIIYVIQPYGYIYLFYLELDQSPLTIVSVDIKKDP
jgi:hypothetical protein